MHRFSPTLALLIALGTAFTFAPGCDAEEDTFSGLIQCEDHDDWDYFVPNTYGERCDDSWEECNTCPEDSACLGGLVSGSAVFGDTPTCARQCETDADCNPMSYAAANGDSVTSEVWTCEAGLCEGKIDDNPQPISDCDSCRNTCAGQGSWCQCDDVCW